MNHDTRLAEMIATRLCHDLTGPIGAVNNGAEFLEEEGFNMQSQAVQLIVSSAHEAVNRLQFYRQAYGRVGETGEASLSDKKQITADFLSGTKVKLDWPDSHTDASGMAVSQKFSRLLLNLIVIAVASAIKGGTLSVRVVEEANGDKRFDVSIAGEVIKLDEHTAAILEGRGDAVTLSPKSAQPHLTMVLASELGANVTFTLTGDSLSLRAVKPAMALASAC